MRPSGAGLIIYIRRGTKLCNEYDYCQRGVELAIVGDVGLIGEAFFIRIRRI
jgi:hypothetical protein